MTPVDIIRQIIDNDCKPTKFDVGYMDRALLESLVKNDILAKTGNWYYFKKDLLEYYFDAHSNYLG